MTVYAIGNEANRLVKIGRSDEPMVRIRAIQLNSPVRLSMLWASEPRWDVVMEKALHGKFITYHSHGEWFDLGDEVDPVEVVRAAVEELAPVVGGSECSVSHKKRHYEWCGIQEGGGEFD